MGRESDKVPKHLKEDANELRRTHGPFYILIVQSMRRHGFQEITKWADHFGIGRTTLYNLLHGRETDSSSWVTPSLETLVKLAKAFDKPLQEIVYMVQPDAPGAEKGEKKLASSEQTELPLEKIPVDIAGTSSSPQEDNSLQDH